MEMTEQSALQHLSELGMDDMPVIAHEVIQTHISPDWFIKYKDLIHKFISSLSDSIEEISFLNLPSDELMGLLMGQSIPQNISIRFRVPLTWGGKLEIDNLFMCRTFPYSHNLDRFLIEQSGNKTIWLPNPAKKVYTPTTAATIGDGGNATTDRITQIASQIASSHKMDK